MDHALGMLGGNVVRGIGDRVNGVRRFAGDALSGNLTGEQVGDAIIGIPGLHQIPIKAVEKMTGKGVKQGFREGVAFENGPETGDLDGTYEIRLPPMPF